MNRKKLITRIDRYLLATVGMMLSAIGIAITIITNLGTAPLSCPSYVFNLRFPAISVGMFTFILNCAYIILQVALLRKHFKPIYLMQIPASLLFGYMIDLSLQMCDWMHPATLWARYAITIGSCLISALGVSIEMHADAWMLSAEMTVYALSHVTGVRFSRMKIVMDCAVCAISAALSLAFFGSLLGDGTYYVIGFGTVICAVMIGAFMKLTDPVVKCLARLRSTLLPRPR